MLGSIIIYNNRKRRKRAIKILNKILNCFKRIFYSKEALRKADIARKARKEESLILLPDKNPNDNRKCLVISLKDVMIDISIDIYNEKEPKLTQVFRLSQSKFSNPKIHHFFVKFSLIKHKLKTNDTVRLRIQQRANLNEFLKIASEKYEIIAWVKGKKAVYSSVFSLIDPNNFIKHKLYLKEKNMSLLSNFKYLNREKESVIFLEVKKN